MKNPRTKYRETENNICLLIIIVERVWQCIAIIKMETLKLGLGRED